MLRYFRHGLVQHLGKGMGGINQEFDVMLLAESCHGGYIHRSADGNTVMERHVLLTRLRAVVECIASLFECFDGFAPLGGSAKNKNHDDLQLDDLQFTFPLPF